jgi:hypothetical protein
MLFTRKGVASSLERSRWISFLVAKSGGAFEICLA